MAKTKKTPTIGRPSSYTEEIADEIINQLSTTPQGLNTICKSELLPSATTVYNWLDDEKHKKFLERYMRAREAQADLLSDEIIEISDTPQEGIVIKTDKDGNRSEEKGDMLGHRKLQVDARKWKASKLAPKKYGDKLDLTSDGDKLTQSQITVVHNKEDIDLSDD